MNGPYRNNVVVANAGDATFDPPLDAIYITEDADAVGAEEAMDIYVGGAVSNIAVANLREGTLVNVGDITRINSTGNAFRYIGLRVLNKSGSSNVTNDVIPEGG